MIQQKTGVNWLLSLTTDELMILNGVMHCMILSVEKDRIQGSGVAIMKDILLKVDNLTASALDMIKESGHGNSES